MRFRTTLAPALVIVFCAGAALAADWRSKVDPWVIETGARGQTEFLLLLREQADLRGASTLANKLEKGAFVLDALRSTAERTQAPLTALLASRGIEHRPFWVANMIWVRGDPSLVEELAAREDVSHVYANPTVHFDEPVRRQPAEVTAPEAVEWNIAQVHAPEVWALGFTGQGIVVGGADTGYEWSHLAIKGKYRGWTGGFADHNYNWHDSIHSGGGTCGSNSVVPCDDHGHGTHTMGTMVGDDGGSNQIGMAPGAKWVGCRNMDQGNGTPATYTECFQWFIAPTNLANLNPDPTKAPHVINNSWGCPPSEGCTDPTVLQTVVENTRAAGIEVVVSAGNDGPGCSSVENPAAIYDASFSIGATDSSDIIAGFSSRGGVTVDGSGRLKPDVSAPGVNVRSSIPGGGYTSLSGTSMAGPHVAGLVALLLSANPGIARDPDSIEPLITSSAVPRTSTQTCSGVPGSAIPNNTYGWGRVDALAAVEATSADLAITQSDSPDPSIPGVAVTYTVTVTNLGPAPAEDVLVTDVFPSNAAFGSATPSQGSCSNTSTTVSCDLGTLAPSVPVTIQIVVTPPAPGSLLNTAGVSANQLDPDSANNSSGESTTVEACPPAAPALTAPVFVPPQTDGLVASIPASAGHTPVWTLTGGVITSGQGTSQITFQSGAPGTTMLLQVVDSVLGCDSPPSSKMISVDFLDVPPSHPLHDDVNTIARNGVTVGCGNGNYCPDASVTRGEMAVFLLKADLGATYPPPGASQIFNDVPPNHFAIDWIEDLYNRNITVGCLTNPLRYCPEVPVTRGEMAVFLLKTLLTPGYVPPQATGIFEDVPPNHFAIDWIEDLYNRTITVGCLEFPPRYCPDAPNTRGEMAVFLKKTFSLQ